MNMKKIAAAKSGGRKLLLKSDTLFPLIFMLIVVTYALSHGYRMFAVFSMGLIVARIGEIIFEIKSSLFDKPFFHCLLLIGIPLQYGWNVITN
ncbi:hypothetical protein OBP_248 [Pseudomonas phage OBP]|uniref:hypothetical protein n=1 Tax=Pseudomonas phage OBP TaxID=1124849 RepID=UPI000240D5DC|nr:hypothetical protein OBP_248 [Pseudomonas phage OBP]AEV89685.1 hypothetical protein OBP_248 [Pseudomonas phage OBP]